VVYVVKEFKMWMKKTLKNEINNIWFTDIISNATKERDKKQNEWGESKEDQDSHCGTTLCWQFDGLLGLLGISMQ
jgi:hypothetical protein